MNGLFFKKVGIINDQWWIISLEKQFYYEEENDDCRGAQLDVKRFLFFKPFETSTGIKYVLNIVSQKWMFNAHHFDFDLGILLHLMEIEN